MHFTEIVKNTEETNRDRETLQKAMDELKEIVHDCDARYILSRYAIDTLELPRLQQTWREPSWMKNLCSRVVQKLTLDCRIPRERFFIVVMSQGNRTIGLNGWTST